MAEDTPDWLAAVREEQDMLLRLSIYASAVPAERIPLFIVDPMLGVRVRPPGPEGPSSDPEL